MSDTQTDLMTSSLLAEVEGIRANNNKLWMKIVEIAIENAPEETRTVLKAISANDRRITACLEKL